MENAIKKGRKADFEKLFDFVGKNKRMNYPTKAKLKLIVCNWLQN